MGAGGNKPLLSHWGYKTQKMNVRLVAGEYGDVGVFFCFFSRNHCMREGTVFRELKCVAFIQHYCVGHGMNCPVSAAAILN